MPIQTIPPDPRTGQRILAWARAIYRYLHRFVEIHGDGKFVSVARHATGWRIHWIGPAIETARKKPFEPYCVDDPDNPGTTLLAVYFGAVNAGSLGLGTIVPTYAGSPMSPPGPITGPLPTPVPTAANPITYWATLCLDVTMSDGNQPGTAFCDGVESITAEVIIQAADTSGNPSPPPNSPLQIGYTDDPATAANEAQAAQSGKIYFSLWQFEAAVDNGVCTISHGIRDESNYYICCIGERLFLRAGPPWQ